jgi:hypothetical protein
MKTPSIAGFRRRCEAQDEVRGRVVPAWAPRLFVVCTILLIPWTILLFFTLPEEHVAQHWDLAWAGFDVGIAVALAATAASVIRRSVWTAVTATMTGTLLCVDAWFDVLTSQGADERWVAVGMAAFCELPLAFLCLFIARNVERVLEQARRYVLAAGYTVEGRRLVPPVLLDAADPAEPAAAATAVGRPKQPS